jgi:hypothetical protein
MSCLITSTRKGTVTREGKLHHEKNKTHEGQGGLKKHTKNGTSGEHLRADSKRNDRESFNKNRVLIFYK